MRVVTVDVVMVVMAARLAPFGTHVLLGKPAGDVGRLALGLVQPAAGDRRQRDFALADFDDRRRRVEAREERFDRLPLFF